MSEANKEKNLQKKIESLIRENKTLRKKLGRLRKVANLGVNYNINDEDDTEEEFKKIPKLKECDYCRGEIKKVSVYNLEFEICQKCKTRVRIK